MKDNYYKPNRKFVTNIQTANHESRITKKGAVLIVTFIIMVTITIITAGFLFMTSHQLEGAGYDTVSAEALWLAEAGLQKAVWNLKTPVGSGGQGEDWTTAGTEESLGDGDYTMVVERWDWALGANDATASSDDSATGQPATNANDGDDETYWESDAKPQNPNPKSLTIAFPYKLTINKVRFLAPTSNSRPRNYKWQVSTDGSIYSDVVTVSNNASADRTDTFTEQFNVTHLRLRVTKAGHPSSKVRVATAETIGSKITSTGTVDVMDRQIEQTVAVDDTTETAYDQIDWDE